MKIRLNGVASQEPKNIVDLKNGNVFQANGKTYMKVNDRDSESTAVKLTNGELKEFDSHETVTACPNFALMKIG